jgi:hypothetical protein
MKAQKFMDQILPILYTVKEDPIKLEKILTFLLDEIYEEPEEEEIQVPDKFLKAVSDIADGIDVGFVCFLNLDTLEVEDIPKDLLFELEEYDEDNDKDKDEWYDGMELKYPSWENRMSFEPLESHESFEIMRMFTEQLGDERLQTKLVNALNHRKPFANFKNIIDYSEFRQDWFDFKKHQLEIHVKELLSLELQKEDGKLELEEQN